MGMDNLHWVSSSYIDSTYIQKIPAVSFKKINYYTWVLASEG